MITASSGCTAFDAPPPAHVLRGRRVVAFHLWGVVGLAGALGLAVLLARALALSTAVMLASAGAGLVLLFLLAYASRLLLGEEVLVNYHHLLAVSATAALVAWMAGVSVLPHLAAFVVSLMVFQGCGRLGCLSAGCCHGSPASWGVRYGQEHVRAGFSPLLAGVILVPVQGLEAAGALLIAAGGTTALLARCAAIDVLLAATAAYALLRLAAELLRGDGDRPRHAGLTQAQWMSLLLLAMCALTGGIAHAAARVALAGLAVVAPAAAALLAIGRRLHPEEVLFAPEHVLELAGALALACGDEGARPAAPADELHVATTSRGVSVSAGEVSWGGAPVRHYTLTREPAGLTASAARRLALLVLRLRHAGREGTLVRGRRAGAYHLVVGLGDAGAPSTVLHPAPYALRTEASWSRPFPDPGPQARRSASGAAPSVASRTSAGPTTG